MTAAKRRKAKKPTKYRRLDIDELGNHLLGSASSLDAALKEYGREDLNDEEQDQLDNIAVLCDGCSWWVVSRKVGMFLKPTLLILGLIQPSKCDILR